MDKNGDWVFYASDQYIQYAVGDVDRAMTLAAFYVAQGMSVVDYTANKNLKKSPMRRDILTFLMSESAVNHWLNTTGRLERCPRNDKWLQLTTAGVNEITASYNGNKKNAARPEEVAVWIRDMTEGGGKTDHPKTFKAPLMMATVPGEKLSAGEATQVMASYYKQHKSSLPKSVTSMRDEIIRRLMQGDSAEDAFTVE